MCFMVEASVSDRKWEYEMYELVALHKRLSYTPALKARQNTQRMDGNRSPILTMTVNAGV